MIQIQFERSSKGIKLDKNLQEEIKAFSIRIDSENYAKLLGYCLEKIRNLKLSPINLADERIYSNLKSFLKTITELSSFNNKKELLFKWYHDFGVIERFKFSKNQ